MKKLFPAVLILMAIVQPVFADDAPAELTTGELMNYWGFGAIVLVLLLLLGAMLMLLHTFKVLTKVLAPVTADELESNEATLALPVKPKKTIVEKLLSLKPLSEEKSILIEHDYDGIQELDNPTPTWFMGLFYTSIIAAAAYLLVYHVFELAPLQDEEYRNEVALANKEKEAYLAKSANRVDENTVKLSTDAAVFTEGGNIFKQNCAACHGDKGQGMVGPNLTDEYWLHGGKISDLFKTIKYGVQAKGMPTWEKQLSPKQIADVANYIKSLYGTHPANAKEPQGDKEGDDEGASAKTAMVVTH
ncbi:hypothetical protein GCM10023149_04630 [Mucilaginibacter gynuensis]|uniref:Cytochrome c domain-containing protein n=1 Tax=Mucilaginibacter gynuensis TaxID=1302236 RepID=A0ABP8FSB9_9SPHI